VSDAPEAIARERAKKRVADVRDFFGHLIAYLIANGIMVFVDLRDTGDSQFLGLDWAYWSIIPWGIGLLIHALVVFVFEGRLERYEERKAKQYLAEEQEKRLRE